MFYQRDASIVSYSDANASKHITVCKCAVNETLLCVTHVQRRTLKSIPFQFCSANPEDSKPWVRSTSAITKQIIQISFWRTVHKLCHLCISYLQSEWTKCLSTGNVLNYYLKLIKAINQQHPQNLPFFKSIPFCNTKFFSGEYL